MKKQYVLIAVISFLLFGIGSAFGQEVSEEAKRHFDRGLAALEMAKSPSDYAAAIKEFEQAARLAPDWPDVYYNLGKVQEAAEKYGDAIRSFREYLRLAPDAEDAEEIKSLINKLEYKAEQILTIPQIIDALTDFRLWDYTVTESQGEGFHMGFGELYIQREGSDAVKALRADYLYAKKTFYQTLKVTGSRIKYVTTVNNCGGGGDEEVGNCDCNVEHEIEVVSRRIVRLHQKVLRGGFAMGSATGDEFSVTFTKKDDAGSPGSPPQTDCGVGDTSGIISYWKFDEINGPLATDSIGQNTGELTYTRPASDRPLITAGLVDNGLRLVDGQYVTIPNNAALNITGDLTIALWVKPNSVSCSGADPAYVLVSKRSGNVPTPYEFMIGCGGSLRYEAWGGRQPFPNAGTEAGLVKAGVWQHVAMTRSYSGTIATVTFYINGVSVGSSSQDIGPTVASPDPVWISRDGYHSVYTSQGTYAGLMDEIAIFNRALSSAEILNIYNNSKAGISYCRNQD